MLLPNENSLFKENLSINLQGFLLDFSTARIMGILNLSPDSFFDGGKLKSNKDLLLQAEKMLSEGASILDLGAFSSRPGAELISEQQELERLIPALQALRAEFPNAHFSVDTYRVETARAAHENGANLINDISGGQINEDLFEYVGKHQLPYVLMHMQGMPKTMQKNPTYSDVLVDVFTFLQKRVKQLQGLGCKDLVIDPGFGFGKSLSHNYQLLKELNYFKSLSCPILVGVSRKKMIQQLVQGEAIEALNGTTVAHTIALLNGANLLRVHDVKAAKEAVDIVDYMQKQ